MLGARWGLAIVAVGLGTGWPAARADEVKLSSGQSFSGMVDRDGLLVLIYDDDGLKRVVLRGTRIESIESTPPLKGERFQVVQPLTVHGGEMPTYALNIEAGPWDAKGRRRFSYVGSRSKKPVEFTQAINELGPTAVRIRGVDGFWSGRLSTTTIPRPVILGILAKVQQDNQDERLRVGRFLIQAEWYDEARAELDRIGRDFPDFAETVATVKTLVAESEARARWSDLSDRLGAGQPKAALAGLRGFPLAEAPSEVLAVVRDTLRAEESRLADARALAHEVREAADGLDPERRRAASSRLLEILRGLDEAPDATAERLGPFRAADASTAPESRFALAISGWAAGPERATADLEAAGLLWDTRDALRDYLGSRADAEATRAEILDRLRALTGRSMPPFGNGEGDDSTPPVPDSPASIDLATLGALVDQMAPPLDGEARVAPETPALLRIRDDPNPGQPTEYVVILPPEYHPLRSYPAVVMLHGDETPTESLEWLRGEASRRGYILIAPEYNLRGQSKAYRYTPGEHAAVELALRDALRRFAIDSNRVYLLGQLEGGHMAWDFGLAHPELFAGTLVVSGLPGKYAWATRANSPLMPMYVALGDLAVPTEDALIFDKWAKPQILDNHDLIYVRYANRGLERLPEEAPILFDWMVSRRRDPAPRKFEAVAARDCDARYFGVVIREFETGRATAPEVADPIGRNLRPAKVDFRVNNLQNRLIVDVSGASNLDVWVSPLLLDFSKRVEVQVNGKVIARAEPGTLDISSYLEDLRIRGDRRQPFWAKTSVSVSGRRP